jgi:hypothetical protein
MWKIVKQPHWWAVYQADKWETANPNGRPKKSFRLINDELKAKGYEPLTKEALIEAYSLVFNTDEKELQEIAKRPETPYALRIIILDMNNKNYRAKALQDYRDYMFGKAVQKNEVDYTQKSLISEDDLID